MRTRVAQTLLGLAFVLSAAPASAQYGATPRIVERATGERYHFELSFNFWNPTPDIVITSEGLGIPGSDIDFVTDLGIEKKRFRQIRAMVRPGTKHKLRFEYTPISYDSSATLTRDVVFNGITYPISLPVETELKWNAYRFTYEWDFVSRPRGFVGLLLEAKYTDVETTLTNVVDTQFVRARAPIPAIGIIGRGYIMPNVAITAEFSGLKIPEIDEEYAAKYFDFDLYGTVNFTNNVGAQFGYRSFNVHYLVEEDEGSLKMKGLYFGGTVRF